MFVVARKNKRPGKGVRDDGDGEMTRRVPQSLRAMDTEHLQCRNFMHPWEVYETEKTSESRTAVWILRMQCIRCGAECVEKYWPTSRDRRRGQIKYPDGYLVNNLKRGWGGRKLLNQNVRHELFDRMVNGRKKRR